MGRRQKDAKKGRFKLVISRRIQGQCNVIVESQNEFWRNHRYSEGSKRKVSNQKEVSEIKSYKERNEFGQST